jgi:hypothetical protein
LQKKKALIPLMLTQGYEADGWLGLLLGTSMWYGFYGDALSSGSGFDGRMDALCREIGGRGRADASAAQSPAGTADIGNAVDGSGDADAGGEDTVRAELEGLRLKQLCERATVEGVDEDAVGDALDADNPKAALIHVLAEHMASKGPSEQMLTALLGGGARSVETISSVLEHAMDVLEQVSASSPRKTRRSLRDVSDRVECLLESIDVEWCDGVSQCGEDAMDGLSSLLVSVRELSAPSEVSDALDAVAAVLECLDRCGSTVVQSMAVLAGSADASNSSSSVLSALESLRGLSEERLDAVSADEAAAYDAVLGHLSGMEPCAGAAVVSGCMALHTLGCRNGADVCATVDALELVRDATCRWLEYASSGGDDYAAGAAVGTLLILCYWECGTKAPPGLREPIDKAIVATLKSTLGTASRVFTEHSSCNVYASS